LPLFIIRGWSFISIVFIVLWGSLITVMQHTSQRMPPIPTTLEPLGFTACDLPCWANIQIGETTAAEVPMRLTQFLPSHQGNVNQEIPVEEAPVLMTSFRLADSYGSLSYQSQARVSGIYLNIQLPLDYLVVQLGTPHCYAGVDTGQGRGILLIWQHGDIAVETALLNTAPLDALLNGTTTFDLRLRQHKSVCQQADVYRWHGFAPLGHY